jgi:hypothetical protein
MIVSREILVITIIGHLFFKKYLTINISCLYKKLSLNDNVISLYDNRLNAFPSFFIKVVLPMKRNIYVRIIVLKKVK